MGKHLMGKHLLVMAKTPAAGEVKTRLCPPCTPEQAALVAEAALADTLAAVSACSADRKVLALAGPPGPWIPAGFDVVPQRGATFAERLANAWCDAGPIGIQIGMDTPQVTAGELDDLLDLMPASPAPAAVLGPASDGGWWVLGLAGADPYAVFADVPMSTEDTGRAQHERLLALGLQVAVAPTHNDIDTFDDLREIAARMPPATRTARIAQSLLESAGLMNGSL